MARKKITHINIGVVLEVNEGGKTKRVQVSAIAPSPAFKTPAIAIKAINQFIVDHAGKVKEIRKATKK